MSDATIIIKLDRAGAKEVRGHNIDKLTPKIARALVERHAGQVSGTVTRSSQNPQTGETWYTSYRVTPKATRKLYDYYG